LGDLGRKIFGEVRIAPIPIGVQIPIGAQWGNPPK